MTDDTKAPEPLTMPPGFRWAPTFEFAGSETVPTGYGYLESSAICTQPIAYTTASRSVVIAHAIVRPAVDAATAELRAELERCKSAGGPRNYVHKCYHDQVAADLRARARKAEADLTAVTAERDAMVTEARAILSDHTGGRSLDDAAFSVGLDKAAQRILASLGEGKP